MAPQDQSPNAGLLARLSLGATNLTKFSGVILGLHEGFGQARPAVMAFAALLVAGVQVVQNFLEKLFGLE